MTHKCESCWEIELMMSRETKFGETSTKKLCMVHAFLLDTPNMMPDSLSHCKSPQDTSSTCQIQVLDYKSQGGTEHRFERLFHFGKFQQDINGTYSLCQNGLHTSQVGMLYI